MGYAEQRVQQEEPTARGQKQESPSLNDKALQTVQGQGRGDREPLRSAGSREERDLCDHQNGPQGRPGEPARHRSREGLEKAG